MTNIQKWAKSIHVSSFTDFALTIMILMSIEKNGCEYCPVKCKDEQPGYNKSCDTKVLNWAYEGQGKIKQRKLHKVEAK